MSSTEHQNEFPAHAATATPAAVWPKVGNDDARDLLPIRRPHLTAKETTMTKPPGAVSSVFDAGQAAKPKRSARCGPPVNPQILTGIPIPPARPTAGAKDTYGDLLKRMKDGDMVALEVGQAHAMRQRAKKLGIEVACRVLENGRRGVWRVGLVSSTD